MGKMVPHDGNSAAAHVAYATNEVVAIYPITPSSPMAEICDAKSAQGVKNIYDTVPIVVEMQSEGGASGAVHGALTTGALTTTFTASQGLLLMIPNMYKIAGELTPTVFHISARSVATHALSIFGDHSDVMAVRQTGFALLASASVQEAMDMALIAQASTLESRVPFLHFFDGFRTSHELQKIDELSYEEIKQMIDPELVRAHKQRAMNPEKPVLRGTSQNPDVFFQGREASNKYYLKVPAIVQKYMDKFFEITGRRYNLFDYYGAPDAERVIVLMGSGAETVRETVEYLNEKGEKVGVVVVRLYRPFDTEAFVKVLPKTTKRIAVLDRTKEPGSIGEPLYEDVRTAIGEAIEKKIAPFSEYPLIIGGRYGLGSKEFNPAMVKAVFDNLAKDEPKNHFTIGIIDDVTNTSLEWDEEWDIERDDVYRAIFYGLGSDGTVGASKNTIKIISELTDKYAQGYFVYDSKKAGAVTISHLRFSDRPIRSTYLIRKANFMSVNNFSFFDKINMLQYLQDGGILLINSYYDKDSVWDHLPYEVQKQIIDKKLKVYVINAYKIAEEVGLRGRINVIMQTAFFKISNIIPLEKAVGAIKDAIKKTYGKKGDEVVNMNWTAVDKALESIYEVEYPSEPTSKIKMRDAVVGKNIPEFVKNVTAKLIKLEGDKVKVSELPDDGTWPTATAQYEKRNIATHIPEWTPDTCIQCNFCVLICPHAAIRAKVYKKELLENAPETFKYTPYKMKGKPSDEYMYTIQVAPEDCTGCGVCVEFCPTKNKGTLKMVEQPPIREQEVKNWDFFIELPDPSPELFNPATPTGSQFIRPLFEFSGACAGCGETPYVKLLTQLFGDRAIIANATGCSSIYGGNLPTTPYTVRNDGRGPTWNNSLFEDTAELALGMRLAVDKLNEYAIELSQKLLTMEVSNELKEVINNILKNPQKTQQEIEQQRNYVIDLKKMLSSLDSFESKELLSVADFLIKKSVWGIGGDGWAYDIGYGGLDHVIASGKNVNLLVLDTEVYSNTGGQASKATPKGGVARFAAAGKPVSKKDLGLMATTYGYVYVARIAIGANPAQAVKAFLEAEAYDGPSLIIAYSHCIAHGYDLRYGPEQQKKAVNTGHWILFRYNPELLKQGKNPFLLDSKEPTLPMEEYYKNENRFKVLMRTNPERAKKLVEEAEREAKWRYRLYKLLAEGDFSDIYGNN